MVRVHKSGSKQFCFRYFIDGRQQLISMGAYCSDEREGALTLKSARKLANHYSAPHQEPETRDVRSAIGKSSLRATVATGTGCAMRR
jgi:hypothetical protein